MKQLNFDNAFPPTPDCIHAAIEMGIRKGQKKVKLQNKIIAMGSIAAALAIMIAVAALAMGIDRTPAPDVLAQPPAADIPRITEEPMVWCTEKGNYYHSDEHCSGMEGAILGTLSYALALDKAPCPVCISVDTTSPTNEESSTVYAVYGQARYYHAVNVCSGQENKRKLSLSEAQMEKLDPCPNCFSKAEQEIAETTPSVFYCTPNGKYYHREPDCSGMQNAEARTSEEAIIRSGKSACPVCVKSIPGNYDLFTTAFGQRIEDLYPGFIYDHSDGNHWIISNGTENITLCEVNPEGTAFFDEELPGLPELRLTGLTADPEQVHEFMKTASAPIGTMYASAPAELVKQIESANSNLPAEELQLQSVTVYFDANRRVNACEMQFGFYDHVKLKWKVNTSGQIELIDSSFVSPGWMN